MNRLKKEFLKSLTVNYHSCSCSRSIWPEFCGAHCSGDLGHMTKDGFKELSVEEYNFTKQILGLGPAQPVVKYKIYTNRMSKRFNRRGEVISEGITSASDLFKFTRKHEFKTYINLDIMLKKWGCKVLHTYGCCNSDFCWLELKTEEEEIEE